MSILRTLLAAYVSTEDVACCAGNRTRMRRKATVTTAADPTNELSASTKSSDQCDVSSPVRTVDMGTLFSPVYLFNTQNG